MEILHKKISLNRLTNRYGANSVLGKDLVLDSDNLFGTKIPVNFDENSGEYFVRFGTLSNYVSWTLKFVEDSVLYQYCKRKSGFFWKNVGKIAEISKENCKMTLNLDAVLADVLSEYPLEPETGDLCVISASADTFNDIFGTLSKVKQFYEFSCEKLKANSGERPQYIDIPILITEKYEDLGQFTEYDGHIPDKNTSMADGDLKVGYDLITAGTNSYSYEPEPSLAYTDSRIQQMKRIKKTYDKDGVEIPFIIPEKGTFGELQFQEKMPLNMRFEQEKKSLNKKSESEFCYYDRINSITFKNESGETVEKEDGNIIVFDYEMGVSMDTKGDSNVESPGIRYVEAYYYTIREMTVDLDGSGGGIVYKYIDIDFTSPANEEWEYPAEIIIDSDDYGEDYFNNGNFIFDEALAGIHNYSESTSNVFVERGTSAAFEAFNLMGQMNSIEEIERYKGDLFKIGKENN